MTELLLDTSSTFADNMQLPVHRWFKYTAGFSAKWVESVLLEKSIEKELRVIDPFVGSGTVVIQSEINNIQAIGIESHPLVNKVANAKLQWRYDIKEVKEYFDKIFSKAQNVENCHFDYPDIIIKCYSFDNLKKLSKLKVAWDEIPANGDLKNLGWFLITSILRSTSHVGTAQWQYVLPNKSKSKVLEPFHAYSIKMHEILRDIEFMQSRYKENKKGFIINDDSRSIEHVESGWANLVITSPPYANNYDYADATRIELSFWGGISSYSDLQETVRNSLVRACTQHVSGMNKEVEMYLKSEELKSISEELIPIYEQLGEIRKTKGGKKNYHFMVVSYLYDLSKVFASLRRITSRDVEMCFVIGDSAPYGIYVPVDDFLGKLAIANGFNDFYFEKTRDRNIKWKNRKHTVPLKEGRLWIK